MNRSLIAIVTALSFAGFACDEPTAEPAKDEAKADDKAKDKPATKATNPHDAFTNLSPEEVDKLIAKEGCTPVDVNGASTREKHGIVPGSVLLTGTEYKMDELPKDKATKLVFYCGSQQCSAAPKAAKLAKDAGYKDINVMRAGIKGWVKAGKKVDKPKADEKKDS